MKYFFDTEFLEDGKTIDLISIGIVAEDGRTFYAVAAEQPDYDRNPWLIENVSPVLLDHNPLILDRDGMRREILKFLNYDQDAEFWTYFGAYDWVSFCQIFGRMIDLPDGLPMFCHDIMQLAGGSKRDWPKQTTPAHNALNDALWTRDTYYWLREREKK